MTLGEGGFLDELKKDRGIREDVVGITVEVVKVHQVVIEEAGWSGAGHDVGGADLLRVAEGALHLGDPLLAAESVFHLLRKAVDHRVPDGAGVLQEVDIVGAERLQRLEMDGAGVVLVEDLHLAIVEGKTGVAKRAIGGGDERGDHDLEAVDVVGFAVFRVDEVGEAELAQPLLDQAEGVVREEYGGLPVDVLGEELDVEVVEVGVGEKEVIGVDVGRVVELVVGREHPPGAEVRGVEDGIAEDGPVLGFDVHTGMTEKGDLHWGILR